MDPGPGIGMDRNPDSKLYLERWLLELKAAATAADLEAHVRAFDGKGGRLLSLELRLGDEALELRYWKRRTGARRVAAATGPGIVARAREVHRSVEKQHRRVLENGFRRFLRRSIRMLEALESAFLREPDLLARFRESLIAAKASSATRPAAVARRSRRAPGGYELLPAAAVTRAAHIWFAPLLEGRFVDLSSLVRPPKKKREGWDWGFVDPLDAALDGIELVTWETALADGGPRGGGASARRAAGSAGRLRASLAGQFGQVAP